MGLRTCSIHADREPGQSSFLEARDNLSREQRRGAWRQRHSYAARTGMAGQLEQVRALDWIASRQHKDRNLHRRNLIDKRLAFVRTEFHGMTFRLGRSAAMDTGQIAGLSHLPDGDEWPLVEVDRVDLRVHESTRMLGHRVVQ